MFSARGTRVFLLVGLLVVLALGLTYKDSISDEADGRGRLPRGQFALGKKPKSAGFDADNKMTRIHAHSSGYTVFENLYYQNGSYVILTSAPWSIPDVRFIAGGGWRHPDKDTRERVKIFAIRDEPAGSLSWAREKDLHGKTISRKDAAEMAASAIDLASPMLINNDDAFVSHYYHWMGEMFLGMWRIWKHWEWTQGVQLPKFKAVAFSSVWGMDELPDHLKNDPTAFFSSWEDPAGANRYFVDKLLDKPIIETVTDWDARDATNRVYRVSLAILADRQAGHSDYGSQGKPFGAVLRLPVADNYLVELRDKLMKDYAGPVSIAPTRRPKVAYLTRQDTSRRLADEEHTNLIAALQAFADEGTVDFEEIKFSKGMSFDDQVATMVNIDFLVAVHGNGLTHSMWMNPGEGRAVFEMMPESCSINDYSPLAHAAGLDHFLVRETIMCYIHDCPPRGCQHGDPEGDRLGPNRPDIKVNPNLIIDQIKKQIKKRGNGKTLH